MEALTYALDVFTVSSLGFLVLGIAGGILLGAAPGLSPTMAVALLIPFTFHMAPTDGLILLGAVYAATISGGAISAILIKVPGAPANIATAFDGFPMAQKGRATEALHLAFLASFVGGVLGMLVLIFLAPPLAEVALSFGPSELFWVAVLGITVIGTVGSKSLVKGLFAGAFGMWLSTIGYSPMMGEARFIFTDHLAGGINIVAALIGMFAIPQVLSLLENARRTGTLARAEPRPHRLSQSLATLAKEKWAAFIGSVAGIVVGVIPGAGGQIAGLVAYDQTRKLSRDPKAFGDGAPGGLVAAESANNAMVGPSLVPLLTLGVPGSPTAAVLMGGLLIHGLFPGPNLFTIHAEVTWTFIWALMLGQLLILLFGLWLARASQVIMKTPPRYMAAGITVLAVIGTYAVQNNMGDVYIMLALGIGMFYAGKVGFEAAPVVLGLILGPIAESNFQQSQMIARTGDGLFAYLTSGTGNLVLIMLCVGSVAYSVVIGLRQRRAARVEAPA